MTDAVDGALDKGTFNVGDWIQNRSYPTKDVPIYLDLESAYKIHMLEQELALEDDPEKVNAVDEEITALREKVLASKAVFHLRGIDRRVRRSAEKSAKKLDDDEYAEGLFFRYLAGHLIRITQPDGTVQEKLWEADEVGDICDSLPDEGVQALDLAMQELTFKALYFDAAVSADF